MNFNELLFHYLLLLVLNGCQCYDIFQANTEFEYKMIANVTIIPDVTVTSSSSSNQANSQWTLSGILRVQRVDEGSIALKVGLDIDLVSFLLKLTSYSSLY